jgi:hypothetical protein
MQIRIVAIMLLCLFIETTKAQAPKIIRAWAFYTVTLPGKAMIDDDGKRINPVPTTNRFIYIEYNSKLPLRVDSVWYTNDIYTGVTEGLTGYKHTVGKRVRGQDSVTIAPRKTNTLLRVNLSPVQDKPVEPGAPKKILIKARIGKTVVRYLLFVETQIEVPPMG